jgi:succinyl-CoA synthetase beta subunit
MASTPRGFHCFRRRGGQGSGNLGGKVWVVKAQIHAGGRGKGGGVKVAKSLDEVRQYAGQILGMQLVTHQTGPEGQKVRNLLIEEGADIKGILRRRADRPRHPEGRHDGLQRRRHGHRGSCSQHPEKILKVFVDPPSA